MVGHIFFAVSQSWVPLPSRSARNACLGFLWKPVASFILLEFKMYPSGFPRSMHGAL